jgi:hypothetical protein
VSLYRKELVGLVASRVLREVDSYQCQGDATLDTVRDAASDIVKLMHRSDRERRVWEAAFAAYCANNPAPILVEAEKAGDRAVYFLRESKR